MYGRIFAIFCVFGLFTIAVSDVIEMSCKQEPCQNFTTFTVVEADVSYFEARQLCQEDGMELLSIETEEKWRIVRELIENLTEPLHYKDADIFWTSGHAEEKDDLRDYRRDDWGFQWTSDNSTIPFDLNYWSLNQPNHAENFLYNHQHCISIRKFRGQLGLNDFNCEEKLRYYICEHTGTGDDINRGLSNKINNNGKSSTSTEELVNPDKGISAINHNATKTLAQGMQMMMNVSNSTVNVVLIDRSRQKS